jgi:hypothetical protein
MTFDSFFTTLKFVGDYAVGPLSLILIAYLGFFKSKFKTYGELEAKLQQLDKLEEIEKSLNNIKNNSEFDYWKRKSDLERLERFAFITLDVKKVITKAYEDLFSKLMNIKRDIISSEKSSNFKYLFDKYALHDDAFENRIRTEAQIMYSIYYSRYESDEFHAAFHDWSEAVYNIEENFHEYLLAIQDVAAQEKNKKETLESISQAARKYLTKRKSLRRDFYTANDALHNSFELISKAIR